jgi:hypothetical protein
LPPRSPAIGVQELLPGRACWRLAPVRIVDHDQACCLWTRRDGVGAGKGKPLRRTLAGRTHHKISKVGCEAGRVQVGGNHVTASMRCPQLGHVRSAGGRSTGTGWTAGCGRRRPADDWTETLAGGDGVVRRGRRCLVRYRGRRSLEVRRCWAALDETARSEWRRRGTRADETRTRSGRGQAVGRNGRTDCQ